MAEARLKSIELIVKCECSEEFLAEELDPECPKCGRRYRVELRASPEAIELRIEPFTPRVIV